MDETSKQLLRDLLSRRDEIIEDLCKIAFSHTIENGIEKVLPSMDESCSTNNLRQQVKTLLKVVMQQQKQLRQMSLLMSVYIGSDEFRMAVGKLGINAGMGPEMIREIFRQKIGGKA